MNRVRKPAKLWSSISWSAVDNKSDIQVRELKRIIQAFITTTATTTLVASAVKLLWLTPKYYIIVSSRHVCLYHILSCLCAALSIVPLENHEACYTGWTCSAIMPIILRTYCRSELYLCIGVLIVKTKGYENIIVFDFSVMFWHGSEKRKQQSA